MGKHYTPEELAKLVKMVGTGNTVPEIAAELGREVKSVEMKLHTVRKQLATRRNVVEKPEQVSEQKKSAPDFLSTIGIGIAIGFAACLWMTSMGVI